MKIALVHDHFFEFGGAERVMLALKELFPAADVYTAAYNNDILKQHVSNIHEWNIKTSWAAHIPFFNKLYSPLRFLTPWIWESFNLSGYDLIISSSGWFMSKGVITKPPTKHICYIHHQPKYLYYYETSLEWQKYKLIKIYGHFINHFLRMWDYISSQRPDYFIANSDETKRRVKKFYRRDAYVIYPPVNIPLKVNLDVGLLKKRTYFITLSRLVKTKNIDLLIKSSEKLNIKFKIIGKGRDEEYLMKIARENVEFLGQVSDEEFEDLYKNAKAFLFAAKDEEFGIAPIEAMGYGVPVIAYKSGGLKETVRDGINGYLFSDLTLDSISEKINDIISLSEKEYSKMCENAHLESQRYSMGSFRNKINEIIEMAV